jgi:hypothetical protein
MVHNRPGAMTTASTTEVLTCKKQFEVALKNVVAWNAQIRRIETAFHRSASGLNSGWRTFEQNMSDQVQDVRQDIPHAAAQAMAPSRPCRSRRP